MKIGEYPRMSSVEDTDVFVFSRPSDGTKSIRVEDLINAVAQSTLPLISETLIEEITEAAAEQAASDILNRAYPIGSIYTSMNATSPAELFGGTWEAIHGRFLVAEGSNGQTGNKLLNLTAGAMDGERVHTLSVAEMPSHTHPGRDGGNFCGNSGEVGAAINYPGSGYRLSTRTDAAGGGQAHNNLPPYLAVYMWKRTA